MPQVLIVSTNGVGYDTVDVDACTAAGILVVNQAGGNREAVAEHALGMLIALSKRIPETNHAMRREPRINRVAYMGNDVFGKTIGIVGLGHVGSRLAQLCRGLFAMQVLAYDPYLSAAVCAERGADKVGLDELMRRSDYVSINCPLTKETRGMIGVAQFALMRPGGYLISTARGHIHDERRWPTRCGASRSPVRGSMSGRPSRRVRAPVAAIRQRAGESPHGGRDARNAFQYGQNRRRTGARRDRRQAGRPQGQS